MNKFINDHKIIGMVHLLPLPGSPKFGGDVEAIRKRAFEDVEALMAGGADTFIVENFNDDPYGETIDEFGFALMTSICQEIKSKYNVEFGVNIQFNDVEKEWALAYACGAKFVRCEVFIDARVGIQGVMNPKARQIAALKNRYHIDALVVADVDVKHTVALVKEPLIELIDRAKEEGADAVILTGTKTGENAKIEDIIEVRKHVGDDLSLVIGSGIKDSNIKEYLTYADAVIVGSSIKIDGNVRNGVDAQKVKKLVAASKM